MNPENTTPKMTLAFFCFNVNYCITSYFSIYDMGKTCARYPYNIILTSLQVVSDILLRTLTIYRYTLSKALYMYDARAQIEHIRGQSELRTIYSNVQYIFIHTSKQYKLSVDLVG